MIPGSSTTSQRFQYDAANRLVKVKTDNNTTVLASYTYGSSNERLIAEEGGYRTYYASQGGTTIAEYTESGSSTTPVWSKGYVWFVVFSPDSKTLATGSDDRTARLWNVSSGNLIATLPHKGTVHSLSFSADGAVISTASDNEKWVNIWRVATGEKLAELPDARPPVAFSPISRTLATASRGSDILLWDIPFK